MKDKLMQRLLEKSTVLLRDVRIADRAQTVRELLRRTLRSSRAVYASEPVGGGPLPWRHGERMWSPTDVMPVWD